jgi:FkbM family methyltransferase
MIKRALRAIIPQEKYAWCSRKKEYLRRSFFEFFGCDKYSKMGMGDLTEKLSNYLNFKDGVFIEVGANDGVAQSNTYYLEKILKWKGYLIEAIPELSERCKTNRRRSLVFNCALVSPEDHGKDIKINYDKDSRGLMSKIGDCGQRSGFCETVSVRGRTLTDVLEQASAQKVDFFSLDVEGFELEVLKGLDLNKYRPTLILVETAQVEAVDAMLSSFYDRIDLLSHHDYLYQAKKTL